MIEVRKTNIQGIVKCIDIGDFRFGQINAHFWNSSINYIKKLIEK